MRKVTCYLAIIFFAILGHLHAQVEDHMSDKLETSLQPMQIELLGHASLRLQFGDKLVYVDPAMEFFKAADYGKVDIILVTHSHRDHLQADLIDKLKKSTATVLLASDCGIGYPTGKVLKNGETETVGEIVIKAVPAYNISHKRDNGEPYHAKGSGNGYVLSYGGKRLYVAGDTEAIPEMKEIAGVDAAFIPANLPYTMDVDQFMQAVAWLAPKRVYPYHYKFGTSILAELLPRLKELKVPFKTAE